MRVSGLAYLELTTKLLQRARRSDPDGGVWEAADFQWWWRWPRRSDALEQLFWVDGEGPVAGVLLTDWGEVWACDAVVVSDNPSVSVADVWPRAVEAVDALDLETVEVFARGDDGELGRLLTGSGFARTDEQTAICWLDPADRPAVSQLPDGFELVDRARDTARPHPLRRRNGPAVEARLRETSLYDPWLDLTVMAPTGDVAGYALFWFDPVTGVGLLEPMRVEDAYQRRGLGRALLTAGLDRLAQRGARRLKVGYVTDAARALYTGAGFRPTATATTYRRTRPVLYSA